MFKNVKVHTPNNKKVNLELFYKESDTLIQHCFCDIAISDTVIRRTDYGTVKYNTSSAEISSVSNANNLIYIYKVIGYKDSAD